MNKWVLMMCGFGFLLLIGVIVILVSEKSDDEVAADISLLSGVRLTQHGQNVCQKEVQAATGVQVFSPSRSTGDRMSTVTLEWDGDGKQYRKIICTYNLDQGVTSMIIDDKSIKARLKGN